MKIVIAALVWATFSLPTWAEAAPPDASKISHRMEAHGNVRDDVYYWLRDDSRSDEQVLSYLRAENAYADSHLKSLEPLAETLFAEMTGRLEKQSSSVPYFDNGYWYTQRVEEGREYRIYQRQKATLQAAAETLLDVNALAQGRDYYAVGELQTSPDNRWLAYTEDLLSRRQYQLRLKNLVTGELSQTVIPNIDASIAWSNDSQHLYYIKNHPETLFGYQLYLHKLGSNPDRDTLIYEERDTSYYSQLRRSRSGKYVLLLQSGSGKGATAVIDANDTASKPVYLAARADEFEYYADHVGDRFYILHNADALNFKISTLPERATAQQSGWRDLVAHDAQRYLESMQVFSGYLALQYRQQGQVKLEVLNLATGKSRAIRFEERAYDVGFTGNHSLQVNNLRFYYSSLAAPRTVYDYDFTSGVKTLRKQQQLANGWDGSRYKIERTYATARDGVQVPVTLFYRKDLFRGDGSNPLMVYGYGSYGLNVTPGFSILAPSLVDRGFVWAYAHIRGSSFLGRHWYEQGRLLNKKNSFNDFVDVTRKLVKDKVGDAERTFAWGRSAGGLLMGAVVNQAPELYRGVLADVPYVDVITTMSDPSIPLTTGEYTEWGNPADKLYYDYMLSYSPYDNVRDVAYPNMLVTTGLWDSQVQYFEPAKWVARLRDHQQGNNLILLKTDMRSGHGGASGRYRRYRSEALSQAFVIGLAEKDGELAQ